MYDMIIIGAGVTGFGAAMYAKRLGMSCLVIGETCGGTIILTDTVENYPGFELLTGQELADNIKNHAMKYGTEFIEERVDSIKKNNDNFIVNIKEKSFEAKTILFATGTKFKKLNIPGEDKFFAKGVHTCALCDGFFYKNKKIAVIGGSDSAAKEAILLSEHAEKVYLIYRGEKIRPEPINYDRVMQNEKIEIINNTNITEIKGDKSVESVTLDNPYNGSTSFALSGIFIAIGHTALSDMAKNIGVVLNKKGEIIINRNAETNIPGFYAAGDVADTEFKQAITGVAEGVTAAYHAFQYLTKKSVITT